MKKATFIFKFVAAMIVLLMTSCTQGNDDLYNTFRNPETKYRPYVRWWWNGDKVTDNEILRELDLLKEAGFGGVEINPIRYPENADSIGIASLEWLSPEWIERLKTAIDGCAEKGLVADMIVGSGWPFGSEYLSRDLQLQLLTVETVGVKKGENVSIAVDDILSRVNPQIVSPYPNPLKELVYLRLMPKNIVGFTPGITYDEQVGNTKIEFTAPADQDYVLYCFVKMTGFMAVINGAPGAQGPVLNHFDKNAVSFYLNRLSDAVTPVIGKMGNGLRAAFCDSFETEGSNWDDNMRAEFQKRRGYDIWPYLPYVIPKIGEMGNPVEDPNASVLSNDLALNDLIERVRNDFETTQREVFNDGFLQPYIAWCRENGLQARIQAYGRGLHPLESSMMLDIPECESWFDYNIGVTIPERAYNAGRGFSMANKTVASGAWLAGKSIVSCEEFTNTSHVFNASLEKLKLTSDMSNLSGVNASIMHGFNYSPLEAPFPGWIRYGAFFNERNTIWPYIRLWTDYKARMSALLQHSVMQADIAVLQPLEDMWSKIGAQRDPFPTHMYPTYAQTLWEAVHQAGGNCDHISERILEDGKVVGGKLTYNSRTYSALLLIEVESLSPKAAQTLNEFAQQGGKVVCIGVQPYKSHGLVNAAQNDKMVMTAMHDAAQTPHFAVVDAPKDDEPILQWYLEVCQAQNLPRRVIFNEPNTFVSQNHYKAGDRDIFYVVNYNQQNDYSQTLQFPTVDSHKTAWIWDAETGERYLLGDWEEGITLDLGPAESRLVVFDNERAEGTPYRPLLKPETAQITLDAPWKVDFTHGVTGNTFSIETNKLFDIQQSEDACLNTFAGEITYSTTLHTDNPDELQMLDAGEANGALVELLVNGKSAGIRWYGKRVFNITGMLQSGDNVITLKLTTVLGNYVKSLTDNPVAQEWTQWQPYYPMGLSGNVLLY